MCALSGKISTATFAMKPRAGMTPVGAGAGGSDSPRGELGTARKPAPPPPRQLRAQATKPSVTAFGTAAAPTPSQEPNRATGPADPKIGRNDPCPCGSGKKYKKCHGA